MSLSLLNRRINRVRGLIRLLFALHGALRMLCLLSLILAALFVLDFALELPRSVRGVLLGGALLVGVAGFYRTLAFPMLFRITDDDIARCVEINNPFLAGRLIAALQLARQVDDPGYADSVSMTRQVLREAASLIGQVSFTGILRPGRVGLLACLTLAVAAPLGVMALSYPDHAKLFCLRSLLLTDHPFRTDTHVGLLRHIHAIGKGESLEVRVIRPRSDTVPRLVFVRLSEGARPDRISSGRPMTLVRSGAEQEFALTIGAIREDVLFTVLTPTHPEGVLHHHPWSYTLSSFHLVRPASASGVQGVRTNRMVVRQPEGDLVAPLEKPLVVRAALIGASDSRGWIHYRYDKEPFRRKGLSTDLSDAAGAGRGQSKRRSPFFHHRLPKLTGPVRFFFETGKGRRSPQYRVGVKIPPHIEPPLVWYTYPAYTNRVDRRHAAWLAASQIARQLSALEAVRRLEPTEREKLAAARAEADRVARQMTFTEDARITLYTGVHLRTLASRPLSRAWVAFPENPRLGDRPLEVRGGRHTEVIGSFLLDEGFRDEKNVYLEIRVLARDGLMNPNPTRYHFKVVVDQPPRIRLLYPSTRAQRITDAEVTPRFEVSDDHGVVAAHLYWSVNSVKPASFSRVVLLAPSGDGKPASPRIVLEGHTFVLKEMQVVEKLGDTVKRRGLARGDTLYYRVEAVDNFQANARRGQVVSSARVGSGRGYYQIRILDKDQLKLDLNRRMTALKERIHRLLVDQTNNVEASRGILERKDSPRDILLRAHNLQVEITRESDTAAAEMRRIARIYDENRLESDKPAETRRMVELLVEVSRRLSPSAGRQLDLAGRYREAPDSRKAVSRSLRLQERIVQRLSELERLMKKWESYNELLRDAHLLLSRQKEANRIAEKVLNAKNK